MQEEKKAQEHFRELKDCQIIFNPHFWKHDFQIGVEIFIKRYLSEATDIRANPYRYESKEEEDRALHFIRRMVAGAVQEGELVWQPEYASECVKLDGALVWEGRGYVIPIRVPFPRPKPSSKSSSEKV